MGWVRVSTLVTSKLTSLRSSSSSSSSSNTIPLVATSKTCLDKQTNQTSKASKGRTRPLSSRGRSSRLASPLSHLMREAINTYHRRTIRLGSLIPRRHRIKGRRSGLGPRWAWRRNLSTIRTSWTICSTRRCSRKTTMTTWTKICTMTASQSTEAKISESRVTENWCKRCENKEAKQILLKQQPSGFLSCSPSRLTRTRSNNAAIMGYLLAW